MTAPAGATGTLYVIHFSRPYRHARHYVGWTEDLDTRLARHRSGNGARLIAVIAQAGIGWQLAASWPGTRADERRFKRRKETPRLCPVCNPAKSG